MKKKQTVLFGTISFPLWLLVFIPKAWLFLLPGLLLFNFAVLFLLFRAVFKDSDDLSSRELVGMAGRSAAAAWLFSFIGWMLGSSMAMMLAYVPGIIAGEESWWTLRVTDPISSNPLTSFTAVIVTLAAIAFGGYVIYYLNRRFSFRRLELDDEETKKLAVRLALITAPYFLLIPSEWFW